jgi:hypothetical protein
MDITMKNFAFDLPVIFHRSTTAPIRTAKEAASILRSHLQVRFTMAGLNALLLLERATEQTECEEARLAFCSWASNEQLMPCDNGKAESFTAS